MKTIILLLLMVTISFGQYALQTDGVADHAQTTNTVCSFESTTDFVIAFRYKFIADNQAAYIIGRYTDSNNYFYCAAYNNNASTASIRINRLGATNLWVYSQESPLATNDQDWHHVIFSIDTSDATIAGYILME